jgi:protein involved in polysaccharide export with SLBB domain
MKLRFHIFLILLTATALYGGFSAAQIQQAKEMVSKNPSLLNTPQAKKMMQHHQKNLADTNSFSNSVQNSEQVKNEIESIEKTSSLDNENIKTLQENKITHSILRLSPQQYKTNDVELYRIKSAQDTRKHKKLTRFSNEFFRNKNKIAQKNINAPRDYIINRGDTISFWVYGATNQEHQLKVNNQGNINIPEIGPVKVAGEKYSEVKELLTNYLSSSYKNSDVVVDLNSYSTAQVTLTGFVNAPGIFNTTSISSVKDILIEAHGVSDVGSVRNIQVKRNGQTIATIDYYHLLTLGLEHGDIVLQPNDTIHVPRAYGLIRLEGAISKEAIYEIEQGESLGHILKIAGGAESKADSLKVYIKRYDRNKAIKYLKISLREARNFRLKDGDEVYVGEMDVTNERYIEIVGNVISEGRKEINGETIKLSTLLKRQMKNGKLNSFFLENTQLDYAVVKRVGKDLTPQMLNINLVNILDGSDDFTLHNKDILYIYNKLDIKLNEFVTIKQELTELNATQTLLMQAGKHLYTKGMTLKDLIYAAGVKSPFDESKVKIVSYDTKTQHTKADIKLIDYQINPDYPLKAFDTVYLFDFFETNPIQTAYITGEVIKPGSYEISETMTLEQFIQNAGGLNEKAYPKECEIIRYYIKNGERQKKIFNLSLAEASSFMVQTHDEINIKRIPNWYERKTVILKGEVKFPGVYVIHSGEKLSSVIKRAGGYTNEAFLYGAVFTRKDIAKLQQKSLKIQLSKLKEQVILASLRASGSKTMNNINITEGIQAVESLIAEAERLTPIGRITINLGYNENAECDGYGRIGSEYVNGSLAGSASDLVLKDKDTLYIPSFNDTVVVSGEVMNPIATTYLGDNIRDYISKSGGLTEIADTDHIYVLHANGEAEQATMGSYLFSSHNVNVKKGDVIIVPKKLMFQRGIDMVSEIADIFYKLTLTVAAMHTVGAL